MIEVQEIPPWSSVSGFVLQQDMIWVLNIFSQRSGVTPPVFVPVENELILGRTGFYTSFVGQFDDKNLEELLVYLQDMVVDGEHYGG